MPTVLRINAYRFFFFSNELNEPAHIHAEGSGGYTKFWLRPVSLAYSTKLSGKKLNEVRKIIEEHELLLMEKWYGYFNKT